MATLSPGQRKSLLAQAGFSGEALEVATAVSLAELGASSDISTDSRANSDPWGSIDRGWVQINSHWHPEVDDACAHDPLCAAQQFYRISGGGSDFSPWSTYTSRAYETYLPQAAAASPEPVDVGASANVGIGGTSSGSLAGGTSASSDGCPGFLTANPATLAEAVTCRLGKMFEQLVGDLGHAAIAATFVVGGLALVVAGVWRAVATPARKAQLRDAGEKAALAAAVA